MIGERFGRQVLRLFPGQERAQFGPRMLTLAGDGGARWCVFQRRCGHIGRGERCETIPGCQLILVYEAIEQGAESSKLARCARRWTRETGQVQHCGRCDLDAGEGHALGKANERPCGSAARHAVRTTDALQNWHSFHFDTFSPR